ncbi:hypothetical protein D3C73_1145070 [compost metagenome]
MSDFKLDNRDDFERAVAYLSGNGLLGNDSCAEIKLDHPLHFLTARQLHDDLRVDTVLSQHLIDKSAADGVRREQNKRRCTQGFNPGGLDLGQRMPGRYDQFKGVVIQDGSCHSGTLADQIADADIYQSVLDMLVNLR